MAIPGYDVNRNIYPGVDRTTAGLGGNVPQQTITGKYPAFYKRLYKSPREVALLLDKPFRAGYGCLPIGTVLAVDQGNNTLVPYTPDTVSEDDPSRVFLLGDCSATTFDVLLVESYKLAANDVITMCDEGGSPNNYEKATIDSIDRTSSDYKATVTLTGSISGSFTVANSANCFVKAKDADTDTKLSEAEYVLDMEVDTGAGEDASGGLGAVLLTNAIIYQDAVVGMDSSAITDLSNRGVDVISDGVYYILT